MSGWTSYFYVNNNEDGDLFGGWQALPDDHVINGPGTHGACPTIRWIPDNRVGSDSGWYYVISGGLSVYLDRSRNLSGWEPSTTHNNGIVLQASINDTSVCSEYIGYRPTAAQQALLNDSAGWDHDASDVDLWELPDGTTVFFYLFGNQGSTIFSALGHYNGTMAEWFAAQYAQGR